METKRSRKYLDKIKLREQFAILQNEELIYLHASVVTCRTCPWGEG